jgi:hypothetical protein
VAFARDAAEIAREIERETPSLAIVDLTTPGWDYPALLDAVGATPVLGFTTHVLARQTQPLHRRCARVVTKETLTQELGKILAGGVAA